MDMPNPFEIFMLTATALILILSIFFILNFIWSLTYKHKLKVTNPELWTGMAVDRIASESSESSEASAYGKFRMWV